MTVAASKLAVVAAFKVLGDVRIHAGPVEALNETLFNLIDAVIPS
jgi:hypothetical protein